MKINQEQKLRIINFLKAVNAKQPEAITTNERAAVQRGLLFVYARQTADEKAAETTKYTNGMGFMACDAQKLSSIAKYAISKGYLTPKQARKVAHNLIKYAGQLALMPANEPKGAKAA